MYLLEMLASPSCAVPLGYQVTITIYPNRVILCNSSDWHCSFKHFNETKRCLFLLNILGWDEDDGNSGSLDSFKKLLGIIIIHCLVWTFSVAIRLRHPPIPSTIPFPWLVALKFQDSWIPYLSDSILIASMTNLIFELAGRSSVSMGIFCSISSRNTTTAVFVCCIQSLTTTLETTLPFTHVTVVNKVTWFWFQWADWISSCAVHV